MELLLLLSSGLPREIVPEAFFRIHSPSPENFLEACRTGKRLLLEQWLYGDLIDISNLGNDPIIFATMNGHLPVVSLLLAPYTAEGHHGFSASDGYLLCHAAWNGHLPLVSFLLDHGADPSTHEDRPICEDSMNGHLEVVSFLLDHRPEMVSLLLEYGEHIYPSDFMYAVRNGYSEIVSSLLAHGVLDEDALLMAASRGHLEIVSLLLSYGADASESALLSASDNGHLEIVSRLLDHGASI